jgi:hypothetical protein
MTREDDFIVQLEGYLDDHEGLTPLPDAVRDAVRAELPTTKQIGPISGLMRNLNMTMNVPPAARYGLAAAAVIAAVLLGVTLFGGGPNVGAGPTPTPIPTPSPTPPPLVGDALDPGTYTLRRAYGTATITVPAGWGSLEVIGVTKEGSDESFMAVLFWSFPDDFNEVYTDPCDWSSSIVEPPVGPTVDDLANALAAQAMRGDAVPTAVTIDGYEGKYLEMSVPTDIDLASCDQGEFRSWLGRFHQGPGQIDRIYIVDVDGQREVIVANHMPGASEADLAEQQAILESIDIVP